MNQNVDPVDAALESLRVRGPFHGDSFLQQLEDRMLLEQQRPAARTGRWAKVAAIAAVCLALGGSGSFAAYKAWNYFSTSLSVDDEGFVYNDDGEAIGMSVDNEDGTSTTTVQMGDGYIQIDAAESLKGRDFSLEVEAAEGE